MVALGPFAIAGPFGLTRGTTKAQVIQLVGKSAVVEDTPDALGGTDLVISTAPKPYEEFEKYLLIISKSDGLLKVVAIGKDIDTSADGEQLRDHYTEVLNALSSTYSTPTNSYDNLKEGSIWSDPQDFMMGLLRQDRTLTSFWFASKDVPIKDDITAIKLSVGASSNSVGYITLGYEFLGFDAYADQLSAKAGSVL